MLFPDSYVNNISERLNLYTRLNELKNEEELKTFENEIIDRFGELPKPAIDLLDSVRLKWLASNLGLEKVVMKQGKLVGYFIKDQQSGFYTSDNFTKILQFMQQQPVQIKIKEKQTRNGLRLLLTIDKIKSVKNALEALQPMMA